MSSRLVAVTALRFLYGITLKRESALSKCFLIAPPGAPSAGGSSARRRSPAVFACGSLFFSPRYLR